MEKIYILSVKIWVLLACAARERRLYTYGGLAQALGMRGPIRKQHLKPIMHYCNEESLPPLTALVVHQQTGLPEGLEVTDRERDQVFTEKWHTIALPNASDFRKAAETAKRRKKP
ncbi:MAG: hypothetical protein MPK09_03175 [Gammaproteobacteria bacterium]|nr:hypothetical protein [Gammaproteobacteria bacterium]